MTIPREVAQRTIVNHAAPCWHCNLQLQACSSDGKPNRHRYTLSPSYRGAVLAWVAEIDGFPRRLHAACAEKLGFTAERPKRNP